MAYSTEVHCPFCHQKAEFHKAPVGSTVRCPGCKSIFRVPAEGAHRVGEKVKKYQRRRHSPVYYVILVIVLAAGVFGYLTIRGVLEAYQPRVPWDPTAQKLINPFQDRTDLGEPGTPLGVATRFMESWRLGKRTDQMARASGFQIMLHYLRYSDVLDAQEKEDPKGTVKRLQDNLGAYNLVSYSPRNVYKMIDNSQDRIQLTIDITCQDAKTKLERRGVIYPVLYYEKHRGWAQPSAEPGDDTETSPASTQEPQGKEGWWVDITSLRPDFP